jgi:hypothetical protein
MQTVTHGVKHPVDWLLLKKLCTVCKAKGYKHGWVWFQYKEKTGHDVPYMAVMKAMKSA